MPDIALTVGVRQSLSAIKSTTAAQQQQQLKLATGKRVNSAIDNPVNFFTSSGLANRARDLGSLLDSIGQATKVIEAADKGIKSLTKLVESAQGSARQALQSTSVTNKIQGIGNDLTAGTLLTAAAAGTFTSGKVIKVNGTTVLTVGAGSTIQNLIDGINTNTTLNPTSGAQKIKAELDANGNVKIEALDGGALTVTTDDAASTTDGLFGVGTTIAYATTTNNQTRKDLAAQFDALRTQIDQLAADSGYNGTNLLDSGSLKVQFNEGNTASITVSGVKFNATGLGVSASTNNWQSDKDINDALTNLTTGLTKLRTQASTFGSNLSVVQTRQDFTTSLIDTLETGSDLLVLADQNEEAAKLVTLNTRQQLASTALSLATQAEQSVLRLF
ncbi:MAG: flagellar protein [Proteobacteria bacterium]|nr:flagellar protein [Pseudomonadota bacterium]